jgi:hypothetical protein
LNRMKNVGMWILFLWLINSVMGLFMADIIVSPVHISSGPLRIYYGIEAIICGSAFWGLFRGKQWGVKLGALSFSLETACAIYNIIIRIVNTCSFSNFGLRISIIQLIINSVFAYTFIILLIRKATK